MSILGELNLGSRPGQVAAQGDSVPRGHPLAGVQRQGGSGHKDRGQQSALSLHTILSPSAGPLTMLPSLCPHTHVAVPCSLPPATNLQGTQSWSHSGPPTPVTPHPHCHSPRIRATAIGAARQEQPGDSETAAEEGSGRRAAFGFAWDKR